MIQIASPQVDEEEFQAIRAVLNSGRLAQGPVVRQFEEEFAEFVDADYAVAVSSGTAALHLALLACGVKPGQLVITTPFTFVATASAILMCGARPLFVDVDYETGNMSLELASNALEDAQQEVGAILPVHLYGHAVNKGAFYQAMIGAPFVWDACQAHNAVYGGNPIGHSGTSCFSFYATKNMTTGEGGMVTTNNGEEARELRRLRSHCYADGEAYQHSGLGYNYRMTEMQAAMGIVQLKKQPEMHRQRKANALFLTEALQKLYKITPPEEEDLCEHGWYLYTIKVQYGLRPGLLKHLQERGIGAAVYYPRPIYRTRLFANLGYNKVYLPVAEKLSHGVLSLPIHAGLGQEQMEFIRQEVYNWAANYAKR